MDTLLNQIAANQENFNVFIQENLKRTTYTPLWVAECGLPDYSASKNFSTYTANYAAAMVASIIEKNADKPLRDMPTVGQISGTVGRMGDRFQLDNDRLDQLFYLEGRYRQTAGGMTTDQRTTQFRRIVDFLFNPFEMAAVAPHKRLDMLLYEGISNGTYTVNLANNPNGIQWSIDLQIPKYGTQGPVWNAANIATMTPVQDIQRIVTQLQANGKVVQKLRMTQNTFNKMSAAETFTKSFQLNFGSLEVRPAGLIPLDKVNQYFTGVGLPPIQIETKNVLLPTGANVNMFAEDRIVFQCADRIASMIIADSLEKVSPLPNRVYSDYNDNLVSYYVNENGRFIEYEMWGLPVFPGDGDFAILKIDTEGDQ